MLTRAAKDQQIKEFNAAFKTSPSVMVIEYIGLSVIEMEKLRKDVRGAQAELRVVKNTLLRLAAKDTDIEQIDELFDGPTAVAICESDPSAVAKVFVDAIKDAPMLKVRGGFVDGSVLDANAISELSKLPSRPELIAQFMGLIITPMSNFVGALSQMQVKLLYALEALKATKEEEPEKAASEVTEDASNDAKESVEETQEAVEETKEASEEAPSQSEEASEAGEGSKEAEAKSEEPAQEPEQAEEKTQEASTETQEEAQESQVAAEAEAQEPEQAEEASEESEEEK
jgi:large subunit ribosomal protein L10